jgi:hypothetical protein
MPTTAPILAETDAASPQRPAAPTLADHDELPDRVGRLESEVAELRETIARFAELVIGEVKDLRQSHAELPPLPPAVVGEWPVTAVNVDPPADSTAAPSPTAGTAPTAEAPPPRRPWLLMELLRDFATTIRMYLDPRYRVRRATQMLVPLIIGLFVFNALCFRFFILPVPILSPLLEKGVDVVLAILLYKVVNRELVRYRHVMAQLVAWQQYSSKKSAAINIYSEPATTRLETD